MGSGTQSCVLGGRVVSVLKIGVNVGLSDSELSSGDDPDGSPVAMLHMEASVKTVRRVTRRCFIDFSWHADSGYPVMVQLVLSDQSGLTAGGRGRLNCCRDRNIAPFADLQTEV